MKIKPGLNHIILGLVVMIGVFLRFYNFEDRISFGWESGRDFFVSEVGWKEKEMPLTGPWASIAPLTTGPWYWYFLIASRFLIPSVYAPWIFIGITSVLTILVMYKIGSLLENQEFGLILAFLTTVSPNLISQSLLLTNPSIIAFLTSVSILVFLKILQGERKWGWGVLFGWLVGISLFTHYQAAGLLILILLLVFLKLQRLKFLLTSLLGLFLAFLPLLLFELNNHWFDTRGIIDFILHRQYQLWVSMRWLTFVTDFFPGVWAAFIGGGKWLGSVLMVISGLILVWRFIQKRMSLPWFLLVIHFLLLVVIVRYWRGERYLGWLQFFAPYILIFTALVFYELIFQRIKRKYFFVSFFVIVVLWFTFAGKLLKNIFTVDVYRPGEIGQLQELKRGEKFALYHCRKDQSHSRDPYLLMLLIKKLYDENGFKIGFEHQECKPPFSEKTYKDIQIIGPLMDFSQASEAGLLKENWVKTTPRSFYETYAKWWFEEKP